MFWIYVAGLAFMGFAIPAVAASARGPVGLALQIAILCLIGLCYVSAAWVCDLTLRARWVYIVAFTCLLTTLAPWWGWSVVNQGVYVSVLLATLIPWRQARVAIVVVNLLIAATVLVSGDITPPVIALIGAMIGLATGAGIEAGRVSARLQRAEQQISALALAAERERIGRDLHDILGHSLTAISIKADLAERLVERDPDAARSEIADLSSIARQSLADVRSTAAGIREVRVVGELASARSVLLAAGVVPVTPTATEPMSDATSELFGYVIREAVTNVVRHSNAQRCVITVAADEVSVVDDGVGISERRSGSGLPGLAARVASAGGALTVGAGPDGGTHVRAVLRNDADDRRPDGAGRGAGQPVGVPHR